jgi:hypothetical protein
MCIAHTDHTAFARRRAGDLLGLPQFPYRESADLALRNTEVIFQEALFKSSW